MTPGVTPNGSRPRLVLLETRETTTFLLEARLRLQYAVIPDWFAVRATGDFLRYGITRDSLATTISAGAGTTSVQTAAEADQIELRARLYADFEVARLGGLVPGLVAGFDYLARSGIDDATAFVPVFGVAIRRTTF